MIGKHASRKKDFGSVMLDRFGELEKKSGIRLKTRQKLLLAETGTLEQALSILTQENIVVKVIEQSEKRGIISRKSVISTGSGKVLVNAQSKIFARALPPSALQLIRSREVGIGSIIQQLELETIRKITQIGYDPGSKNLFRKYQIILGKRVGFEIREEFLS
jgi:chorismate-pyruvate lyase